MIVKNIYKLLLVFFVVNADAMLSRAVRAYASFGKSLAKRLPLRARAGTVAAGTGLTAYSFWPFSKKKQAETEVEIKTLFESHDHNKAVLINLKTNKVDITYTDDEGNSVKFPSSVIERYPHKSHVCKEDGRRIDWRSKESVPEVVGSLKIYRETDHGGPHGSGQQLKMAIDPLNIPDSWKQKMRSPYLRLWYGYWVNAFDIKTQKYIRAVDDHIANPHKMFAPKGRIIFQGNNPPSIDVHLPIGTNDGLLNGKCRVTAINKGDKPGIKARCENMNMTVSVIGTTAEPLAYDIHGYGYQFKGAEGTVVVENPVR